MKSAKRLMVFLTGFACLAFASAPSAIVIEAQAATITYPMRIVQGPIGVIDDLVYSVNGVTKNPDNNNQIVFTQPKTIKVAATCYVEVPQGYARDVTFYCDWKLEGPDSGVTAYWNPTLSPGTSNQQANMAEKQNAEGDWTSTVKISWTDSTHPNQTALDSRTTTFAGE